MTERKDLRDLLLTSGSYLVYVTRDRTNRKKGTPPVGKDGRIDVNVLNRSVLGIEWSTILYTIIFSSQGIRPRVFFKFN